MDKKLSQPDEEELKIKKAKKESSSAVVGSAII